MLKLYVISTISHLFGFTNFISITTMLFFFSRQEISYITNSGSIFFKIQQVPWYHKPMCKLLLSTNNLCLVKLTKWTEGRWSVAMTLSRMPPLNYKPYKHIKHNPQLHLMRFNLVYMLSFWIGVYKNEFWIIFIHSFYWDNVRFQFSRYSVFNEGCFQCRGLPT